MSSTSFCNIIRISTQGQWFLSMAMGGAIALSANCVSAQIIPDGTLPDNSIVPLNCTNCEITGGTKVGENLFHSFTEFSVSTGGTAYFNNVVDIQNIISRVTGKSVSSIDGLIRANDTANLFLINPNGIVFGQNAQLNIGGSFVATTANAIAFGDQGIFSATNPTNPSLLTINPSAFLFNQIVTAPLQNNSANLSVKDNLSLLLVGGDVDINGGSLKALGGEVELGGLTGEGIVGLNVNDHNLSLNFPPDGLRASVSLTNGAEVDVASDGGGSIVVNAQNIDILEGSSLRAGISLLARNNAKAGDVTLSAKGTVRIENSSVYNVVFGLGNGGFLHMDVGKLIIQDGIVATATLSNGIAGELFVNASESIELTGSSSSNGIFSIDIPVPIPVPISVPISVPIGLFSASINANDIPDIAPLLDYLPKEFGNGSGGGVTIKTGQLIVSDGAAVWAGTTTGKTVDLFIDATESVEIKGTAVNNVPSLLVAGTQGDRDANNVTINTRKLIVRDGGIISAGTSSLGKGGDLTINADESVELIGTSKGGLSAEDLTQLIGIGGLYVFEIIGEGPFPSGIITGTAGDGGAGELTINTGKLFIQGGAQASVATLSTGNAGNLTVNATSIELSGTSERPNPNDIVGRSLLTTATGKDSIQKGGDINLFNVQSLKIIDGAALTVSSSGQGAAGNIEVQAGTIRLNSGVISAETANNEGGNIKLDLKDLLLLRDYSKISTSAGTELAGGNGGNITINIPNGFIAAVPNENSDITANAFKGQGGKVTITATNVFGLEPRSRQELEQLLRTTEPEKLDPKNLLTSDITAISQTNPNLNGIVEFNTTDIDPSRGLVQLPISLVDASQQIDTGCNVGGKQRKSSFVVTGRGGLPPQPGEALRTEALILNGVEVGEENRSASGNFTPDSTSKIVEAQGWVVNSLGEITLTAYPTNVTPSQSFRSIAATCHAS